MQVIKGTVGENAANAQSDAALVQAILVKTFRPPAPGQPGGPYLAGYDGVWGDASSRALRAFQNDNVFVSAAGNQSLANPNATPGQVKALDATWNKLLAKVPPGFANMRVLPGEKIVYVEATAEEVQSRVGDANGLTFQATFKNKVITCINQMHQQHGIAVGVCSQGDRRTFQAQYALFLKVPKVTNAGPGESNHNFGMGVDLGFKGLKWLHKDGTVDASETSWLHHLDAQDSAQAAKFWDALRAVGTSGAVGAFRGPVDDRPHLQNWNDATVSMGARLCALLEGSGTMKWAYVHPNYHSDLGLGGAKYSVGKAADIWNNAATLAIGDLTQARAAAATAQGKPSPAAATQQDLTAMRQTLRQQFDLADSNWQNWTP